MIGKKLRSLRKNRGLTLTDLGEKLYMTSTSISNYETGTRLPPLDFLMNVAKLYGITIDEILAHDERAIQHMSVLEMQEPTTHKRMLLDGKPLSELEWYWFVNMIRSYRQMKGV